MKPVHEEISDLLADEQEDRFASPVEARRKAMDFLARREYGRVELERKLIDKGFEPDATREAVAKLVCDGLQSDGRFAESFVQSRVNQGKGPVRIRAELGERGIGDEVVSMAIEEAGIDWNDLARDVRRRKFGQAMPGDFREKARQMRFLQYRGFEMGQIQAAVGQDAD